MSTQTRPRQTTFAGGMIVLGSVFLLLTVWESVTGLRGIESRESVEEFLSEPPGSDLGLTVEGTLQILRGVATVAGVCAAVAAVLGVYALRGHRPARIGLSVLAVPLFLSGIVAGGFMSSIVAVAIALLWVSPSREWFRGDPLPDSTPPEAPRLPVWPPPPGSGSDSGSDSGSESGAGSGSDSGAGSGAGSGTGPASGSGGQPAAGVQAGPGTQAAPGAQPGWPGQQTATPDRPAQYGTWPSMPPTPTPDRRPEGVTLAFVLTVVSAGLVLLLTGISVLVMAVSPDLMWEEVQRQQPDLADQGVTQGLLQTTTYAMGGFLIVWAAAAIVLAFLTLRRNRGAARALTASAAASAVLCVVGTFASILLALPAFASIITLAALRRPEVRAWLAGNR